MSVEVNSFNEDELKEAIKNCPKIIKEYINALKSSNKRWQFLVNECGKKLKKNYKELEDE